ncbi:unnamed protein product [Calypogeia fissa]
MEKLIEQVTGDYAPEKLEITRKDKKKSFQATFDQQAFEALEGRKGPRKPRAKRQSQCPTSMSGSIPDDGTELLEHAPNIPTRQRKSRVAPKYPLEAIKEEAARANVLRQPLSSLQSNLIGNIRIGSTQAWAMSPNFQNILQAFSVGAQKLEKSDIGMQSSKVCIDLFLQCCPFV